ncbi:MULTISPECIES: hypothetical protein [unclassified Mesorhizobium]|uniref:hypothetical protein n=1 Tax=unclassified Mesorhizobium TaxID=325217 RepID=UPI000FCC18C5|nr:MULTISPECIES: hypothetical protein [unclassified Mesorhizobium]RUU68081.1 hypothetical protein EOC99_00790 [Mesorhizobium sp. M7A.T.Ca.TU.009.01.1.1]RVD56744.1 hypothetical protein EN746_04680 [Mesorhizobium sp. M8A.F.Ca.ET.023.02.2.1]TGR36918.1 hypothetical protein EN842_52070 [bacterium M00.F.Ca.ET.199.01.1.1]TGU17875.1 hypothetical protein EN799_62040 [bacterium M00.F.Ca.ET.156.01.1.1]TGV82095.1 hypothetical protein EN792_031415 [Mesorhizobium sp. M00.F.Ca.ET.149.01.1.1]
MDGNLLSLVLNADAAATDDHPDQLAEQVPGHTVGIRVELDAAIGLNPPGQIPDLPEWCTPIQRPQRPGFRASEPLDRQSFSTRIANLAQDTSQTTSLNTCHRPSRRCLRRGNQSESAHCLVENVPECSTCLT